VFQILDPTGRVVGVVPPDLSDEQLVEMFRLMLFGRAVDQKAISLQRRGKLGTFAPMMGQEATAVGSVFALDPETDWVVPQYREQLAMLHWGLELSTYFLQRQGHPVGSTLPTHRRLFPQQVALGAHLPQAVGVAWGMRLKGERSVAIAYFGDGASSEGDFHEALNLAGVQRAPVIFVCQNNQWAISTPITSQTAAATIASRAEGYGIAGVQVDGNDALAMYAATRDARARALAGDGPTLVEAVTYRLGAHTTADDPTRYVDPAEHERWVGRDPLIRFEHWLRATGRWDDAARELADKWCEAEVDRAVEGVAAAGPPDPLSLFDNVYAEEPEALRRQRATVRALLEGAGAEDGPADGAEDAR
jgi:pyruvate dehydrogenase E1 component alpha subunit